MRNVRALRDDPESLADITSTIANARKGGYEFSRDDLLDIYLGVNLPEACRETLRYDNQGNAVVDARFRAMLDGVKPGYATSCEERAKKLLRSGVPVLEEVLRRAAIRKESP